MNVTKVVSTAILPSIIVAVRFLIPGAWGNGNTWAFAIIGFIATFAGCITAAVVLRRRIGCTPHAILAVVGVTIAAALLAIFTTMPSWPFAGIGFIVAWVLVAAGFTIVFVLAGSYRYA
ncbi:hypothetical protein [Usitatibacter rugosus]|uniref:hypothetical protein n=1 Tax=Usitatibacter rugosus TaxID=2732067 RepID=UPI0014893AF6|nr:hypothetical protein [Usitatibacter rugosus]